MTESSKVLQLDAETLYEHVSTHMETAMGRPLPQMEVRFSNLSLSAEVQVTSDEADVDHGLPTVTNVLRASFREWTSKKDRVAKLILRNMSGVFKPASMTLVLGQPGSGKSALLKILSGRFPMASNITLEGDITYNGVRRDEIRERLPQFASYVTQRDAHFPMLSVKETLDFAHKCSGGGLTGHEERQFGSGGGDDSKAALEAARMLYKHHPEIVIQQLGLSNCQDTVVGDVMLRGISGGERKRVTMGEMQFGNRSVLLLDEISSGLDSAATFDIVKTQRTLAKKMRKTVVIALLQPAPEVFALFDDVLLLNDGYVTYHGPCDQVMGYFENIGFVCPPNRDAADFLIDLGTKQQQQYESGTKATLPRQASEFAELFEKSSIHEAMLLEVHSPVDPELLKDNENYFAHVPEFHQSFWQNTALLVARQLKIMGRNSENIKGRAFMVVVVGLVASSIFWQFDPNDIQLVMGVTFQGILFLDLGQLLQLPFFMSAREMFYKQRAANFYRTSSYVVASSIAQIPIAFSETLVFGTILYWMCGFVPVFSSFVVFEALVFLTNMVLAALFFAMAALCKDLNVVTPVSLVAIMFITIFSGFLVSKDTIPGYMIWAYWLNPITWCVRGVAINQYRSFNVDTFDGIAYKEDYGVQMGEYLLSLFDIESGDEWIAYSFIALVALLVMWLSLAFFLLEYVRFEGPEQASASTTSKSEGEKEQAEASEAPTTEFTIIETPRAGITGREDAVAVNFSQVHKPYFTPVTVAFEDLRYSVPNPRNPKEDLPLLKGISGYAKPGTMTALMGSSGAGKTTLMDVIAGRKIGGKIQGKILLNGYEATDLAIRRSTGYCEQMDVHSEASTFREALTFCAFLRQDSSVSDEQKYDSVEECLDLLELRAIADQIIRGSSVEQMKRLTIGVELAAQPSVLFLDEPTSGLDARVAKLIMDGVRKVTNTGRTVVCTIHQPSWEVFQVFDSLLLLKRGGETVYFGEIGSNAQELVGYFESISGVKPMIEGANPATWMLEVIGAGVDNTSAAEIDFESIFNTSEKKAQLQATLRQPGVAAPQTDVPALEFTSKRAASEMTQAKFLIQRFHDLYWRTPSYTITRFAVSICFALVYGLTYVSADYTTYQGINSGQGMMYYSSLFLGIVSFNSVIPLTVDERPSFYRERASQTYSAWWYFVGGTIVEIPYVLASTLVFTAIFFPMVGFTGVDRFVLFWINCALFVLMQTYWAQVLVYGLPSIEMATTVGMLVLTVAVFFSGFNPPASAIPIGYKWFYHITPHKYTLAIISAVVFGDCPPDGGSPGQISCQVIQNLPPTLTPNMTITAYVEQVFLMRHDEMWINFGIVIAFIVLFRVLSLLALRFLNFQKR